MKELSPFFCRIGTKKIIKKEIIKRIPSHKTYIEPFVGGGAILFGKEPSEIEIINDLDTDLMKGYSILKNIKNFKNADINQTNLNELNKYYNDNTKKSDSDKLIKSILKCNTFGSTGKGKLYKSSDYQYKTKKIPLYQERLKNVKMFNRSYENIIKKYDNKDTFYFLDPPYEDSKKLYEKGEFDLKKLQEILKNIKGKFLLTLNDSQNVRELFKNYNITRFKIIGQGNKNIGQGVRYELFITNY